MQYYRRTKGFTLIEVMIGLVLSLVIVLGMLQIFIASKRSYSLGNSFAMLQEQSRFATIYLSQFVRLAGYRSVPNDTLFEDVNDIYTTSTPYISVQNNNGQNNSDILTIRYQGSGDGAGNPDGTIVDCLNQPLDANNMVTLTFSLNTSNQLQCRSQNPDAAVTDSTLAILDNVENIQILLGEDLNNDKTPDRFVAPNHPDLNNARVIAIRFALLLRSSDAINLNADSKTYNLLGTTIPAANDNFLRIPVSTTIQLRNLIYEVL